MEILSFAYLNVGVSWFRKIPEILSLRLSFKTTKKVPEKVCLGVSYLKGSFPFGFPSKKRKYPQKRRRPAHEAAASFQSSSVFVCDLSVPNRAEDLLPQLLAPGREMFDMGVSQNRGPRKMVWQGNQKETTYLEGL